MMRANPVRRMHLLVIGMLLAQTATSWSIDFHQNTGICNADSPKSSSGSGTSTCFDEDVAGGPGSVQVFIDDGDQGTWQHYATPDCSGSGVVAGNAACLVVNAESQAFKFISTAG